MNNSFYFNREDAGQIAMDAFVLALPVSFSEEAWKIGFFLPAINLFLVFLLSIIFIDFFTYSELPYSKN